MSGEDQEVRAVVEDGSNGGSGSPSPGDTLPWNLEKTQRSRRGGGGPGGNGSVLDPAERAVIRIAGNAQELGLSGSSALARWLSPCCVFCAGLQVSEERSGGGLQGGAGLSVPSDCGQHSATCWPRPVSCTRPEVELAEGALPLSGRAVRPQ